MREFKFKHGVIKYREPNVIESLELLQEIGMTPGADIQPSFAMLAKTLKCAEQFVERVDVKFEGKQIRTWEDLISHRALAADLVEMASAIMNPPDDGGQDLKK